MSVGVTIAMTAMAPAVVMAIPAVVGRLRVVTGGLHVPTLRIGMLCGAVRLALCHTFTNGGTCRTAHSRTQHGTIAASGRLAYRSTGSTADSASDDGAVFTGAVGADCRTCSPANGSTDHRTLVPTHLLAQNGPCRRADTTTQNGFQFIGLCWSAQGTQHQVASSDQCGNDLAGCQLPG